MNTETHVLETVWSGEFKGVYLGALKGIEPHTAHEVQTDATIARDHWNLPTGQLILRVLRERGPMNQTQLASACNRCHSDVRKALKRRYAAGDVFLEQPSLLAMEPRLRQLWRVK